MLADARSGLPPSEGHVMSQSRGTIPVNLAERPPQATPLRRQTKEVSGMAGFYEFFAGGGMARLGLGSAWTCLFANDIDAKKCETYGRNWGRAELKQGDVGRLTTSDLPGVADLAWASFPCQDLSVAGTGAGLGGKRSGTFWSFWGLMEALREERRAPSVVVLENVAGALTSHGGKDFAAIGDVVARTGYRFGALVVDAVHFLPQSRPRLFVIAANRDLPIPTAVVRSSPDPSWSTRSLERAACGLPTHAKSAWIWWSLPLPSPRTAELLDILDDDPNGVAWHSVAETRRLLGLMTPLNRAKVTRAQGERRLTVGAVYRRTRMEKGVRRQRAEIRFDGLAGCLRTGSGGSSRQIIMTVNGERIRSRLLSAREAARLMGLPDDYRMPKNYRDGYHLAGDGVAVPVVRHIGKHILEPLVASRRTAARAAA